MSEQAYKCVACDKRTCRAKTDGAHLCDPPLLCLWGGTAAWTKVEPREGTAVYLTAEALEKVREWLRGCRGGTSVFLAGILNASEIKAKPKREEYLLLTPTTIVITNATTHSCGFSWLGEKWFISPEFYKPYEAGEKKGFIVFGESAERLAAHAAAICG